MSFKQLLQTAQAGDQFAVLQILALYEPLLIKESRINGVFDEDLYQELRIILLNCIRTIRI